MKNLFLGLALLCSMGIFASAPVEKSRIVATQEIINKDGSKTEIVIVEGEDFAHTCVIRYTDPDRGPSTTTYYGVPDNVTCTEMGIIHALQMAPKNK